MTLDPKTLASLIDHTLLKPEATATDIDMLCAEALEFGFKGVCVNSFWVERVTRNIGKHGMLPVSVVGFPLGAMCTSAKAFETNAAVDAGALEIDMVVNVGAYLSGFIDEVRRDIAMVVRAANDIPVKVILETSLLNTAQIRELCLWSVDEGASFVKTSTGFGQRGATVEDVRTMKSALVERDAFSRVQIKASGGIRSLSDALALCAEGATRLGTSKGVQLVKELLSGTTIKPQGATTSY